MVQLVPSRTPSLAKYELLDELGHGGMATVYRARDRRLGREVAVKVLHPHLCDSVEMAHRFAAEAKAVAKLRHPNIVEVYDVADEEDPERFLVVELVEGCTLRKVLEQHKKLPPEVAAAIAIELLQAIEHAHEQGVIHRDIKPENVMIRHRLLSTPISERSNQARASVKLMDFGIAKLLDVKGVTSTGQVLGSPAYMAPEQIEGGSIDERTDVFGLGVLLYEMMVGHLPFDGTNPAQVLRRVLDGDYAMAEREDPTIGNRFSSLLDRALAKNPADRFVRASEFEEALQQELVRLGFDERERLISDFFDDAEGFSTAHNKLLRERLFTNGKSAHEAGRALDAASDLNRALAYSPGDAELLRLVTGLRQRQRRQEMIRKYGRPTLLVAILGAGVGVLGSKFAPKPIVNHEIDARIDVRPTATSSQVPSVPVSGISKPSIPLVRPTATQKTTKRMVRFVSVRPIEGVLVSVDGALPQPVSIGGSLAITEREHELRFACVANLCDIQTRVVGAGERDAEMSVVLSLKPAKLLIDGDPEKRYQLKELQNVSVRANEPASIPMGESELILHVIELETSKAASVKLHPGAQANVSFQK